MNYFEIFWIALTNSLYRFFLFIGESYVFWDDWELWKLRWLLFSHYFLSHYWIRNEQFSPEREGDFTYGETPFWTARQLLIWSDVKPGDTMWDLGCGRGSLLFFGAIRYNLSTVGVDLFCLYSIVGKLISKKLNLQKMTWLTADFLQLDFSKLPSPNLVYIAGTTFSETTLETLTRKLESLQPGTKIISLSAALPSNKYTVLDRREFWFSWGKATAYLQAKM